MAQRRLPAAAIDAPLHWALPARLGPPDSPMTVRGGGRRRNGKLCSKGRYSQEGLAARRRLLALSPFGSRHSTARPRSIFDDRFVATYLDPQSARSCRSCALEPTLATTGHRGTADTAQRHAGRAEIREADVRRTSVPADRRRGSGVSLVGSPTGATDPKGPAAVFWVNGRSTLELDLRRRRHAARTCSAPRPP